MTTRMRILNAGMIRREHLKCALIGTFLVISLLVRHEYTYRYAVLKTDAACVDARSASDGDEDDVASNWDADEQSDYQDFFVVDGEEWEAGVDTRKYIEAKFGSFCYKPKYPYFVTTEQQLHNESELERRGCQKRLPDVIIGGVKKCGTGAVLRFLNLHPDVTGSSQAEVHYFDSRGKKDLAWYRDQMPYSTREQVVVEKTPQYFNFPHDAPERIRRELSPDIKIIFVLCEPVRRAVSDYLEYQWRNETVQSARATRKIRSTFESTVVDLGFSESIKEGQAIIDLGVYVKYLVRWYNVFTPDKILLLDGAEFSKDPYEELRKTEKFLGVRQYFRPEHFYVNPERGIQCVKFPGKYCLPKSKGRQHPYIDPGVWDKLCQYYAPYNRMLKDLYQVNFPWIEVFPRQELLS